MAGARFDALGDAGKIASPALVIHGSDDRYVPVANAAALAEAIPDARLRILDGAGHLVFIERAKEVNQEIVSFLDPRGELKVSPAKRKMKQLATQARDAREEAARKAKKVPAFEKLGGRLRRSLRVPGDWARKLRDWFYR